MRKPVNPFIITGYHSPAYFCDRTEELSWLQEQFVNERNIVLYSWRRMGKTALVSHFFHNVRKDRRAEGVFVDLLGTSNLSDANRNIAEAIVKQLGNLSKGIGQRLLKMLGTIGATIGVDPISGTPQVTFGVVQNQSISTSLEALGGFLLEMKTPIIICIDEFQQVVNYPEKHAEATFRTWIQNLPMVRFIFLGSQRHMMTSMFSEKNRPFYRSAQMRQLDPLPDPEYSKFIKTFFRKNGKSIESIHIDIIFKWTRKQTYYVQLVCNKLFGKTDQVSIEILEEIFREIIQQEIPLFSSYQKLLPRIQWQLLIAIARAEEIANPYSQAFLQQHGLGASSSVSSALQNLTKKELVIHHNQNYTLHDTLLMRWLQQI